MALIACSALLVNVVVVGNLNKIVSITVYVLLAFTGYAISMM